MIALEHTTEHVFLSTRWEDLNALLVVVIILALPVLILSLCTWGYSNLGFKLAIFFISVAVLIATTLFVYNYKGHDVHLTKYFVQDVTVEELSNNYNIYKVDWPYFYIVEEE